MREGVRVKYDMENYRFFEDESAPNLIKLVLELVRSHRLLYEKVTQLQCYSGKRFYQLLDELRSCMETSLANMDELTKPLYEEFPQETSTVEPEDGPVTKAHIDSIRPADIYRDPRIEKPFFDNVTDGGFRLFYEKYLSELTTEELQSLCDYGEIDYDLVSRTELLTKIRHCFIYSSSGPDMIEDIYNGWSVEYSDTLKDTTRGMDPLGQGIDDVDLNETTLQNTASRGFPVFGLKEE